MKTILLADDDRLVRSVVHATLEDSEFRILEAQDGHQALAMARSERPDLIVMDLNMPGLNGVEVGRLLSQKHEMGPIPIILLTGNDVVGVREESGPAGIKHFMTKPFSPLELLSTVEAILSRDAVLEKRVA